MVVLASAEVMVNVDVVAIMVKVLMVVVVKEAVAICGLSILESLASHLRNPATHDISPLDLLQSN